MSEQPAQPGPLVVQSDRTVLLEVDHPQAEVARRQLAVFAELERAPEHIHTYRITPLGLWNARAAGVDAESVVNTLLEFSRYPVPHALLMDVDETMTRWGRLVLEKDPVHGLVLRCDDPPVYAEIARATKIEPLLGGRIDPRTTVVHAQARGELKQQLLKLGWPAEDRAGYVDGTPYPITLSHVDTRTGAHWELRPYQAAAADAFWAAGAGTVVLPCGAGKTVVGAAVLAASSTTALILCTSAVAARQWRQELLARTSLTEDEVSEYTSRSKTVRPVTIATYQMLATRRGEFWPHLELLDGQDWGLIIYDEVHLLPAPVFRRTAEIQARRRLGLTATLVREDGREGEVFSLIGPKRFEAPWKSMEAQGWIAPAECVEVRVDLPESDRLVYATAEDADRYRLAASSPLKTQVVRQLLHQHPGEQALVIGQFVEQLEELGEALDAPVLTGKTPPKKRQVLYDQFRSGAIPVLVVSKVANFSVDLPSATVAVQVSGTFGSRQEEAQRLGRLLRPAPDGRQATFYTVVARDTVDTTFAAKRQRFLAEQGYSYRMVDAGELPAVVVENQPPAEPAEEN
ncbi:DNA repair helicase XPB [Kocuria sp.]|uniref:DNA repair helicase XPB n=1 Tax=Kocuria sp. TaxID=1871328 RepID=UPI0026DEB5E7|nr:DNA repair helicase XPB [Kocuria sp.]MDO5619527.1 DEAD/DEAH box helicase [Kocuria sp.]